MNSDPGRQWVVLLRTPARTAGRLFCFPPAGSGTAAYRGWSPFLSPDIQLLAVLLPGRETRFGEAALDDMEEVVSRAADAIAPLTDEPFTLFGHSLGSLVAHEVARRLTDAGCPPDRLIVSGHQAPSFGHRRPPIAHLPDAAFLRGLRELGGTPDEVFAVPELLELLTPMLRADFALAERYRPFPGPRLGCAVGAIGGTEDPWIDAAGLDGWREVTTGPFDRTMLPGDHFYLSTARAGLVARVNGYMARSLAAA